METIIVRILRVAGILVTALAIPVALLMILALQGISSGPVWIQALHFISTLTNLIAIPFILVGFITRYRIKVVLFLAIAHLLVFLAEAIVLLTPLVPGDISIVLMLILPSALYIIGWALQKN